MDSVVGLPNKTHWVRACLGVSTMVYSTITSAQWCSLKDGLCDEKVDLGRKASDYMILDQHGGTAFTIRWPNKVIPRLRIIQLWTTNNTVPSNTYDVWVRKKFASDEKQTKSQNLEFWAKNTKFTILGKIWTKIGDTGRKKNDTLDKIFLASLSMLVTLWTMFQLRLCWMVFSSLVSFTK